MYAAEARQLLDLIGIGPGAQAVDVGCGVLGILQLLCERVGPDGRVVGVNREPRMIEAARRVTAERGLVVELIKQDATRLSLPSDSFDLVHERTVLLNIAEPGKVVAEMVRVARREVWSPYRNRTRRTGCATRRIRRSARCTTGVSERSELTHAE